MGCEFSLRVIWVPVAHPVGPACHDAFGAPRCEDALRVEFAPAARRGPKMWSQGGFVKIGRVLTGLAVCIGVPMGVVDAVTPY